jgi:protein-S-isoprenylcysteine O-methyltransferase Ste14
LAGGGYRFLTEIKHTKGKAEFCAFLFMNKEKFVSILKYTRAILFFFGLPALVFIVAGTFKWWQAWVYIGISYAASITSRALITRIHPDLVQERVNYSEKADAKKWDKFLMPIVALISPAAYFITAGLDKRFGWSSPVPVWLYITAFIFTLIFYAFSTWALATNRFFSAVVRIQTDRGHTVVDTGPYRYIRHPGYLAGGIILPIHVGLLVGLYPRRDHGHFYHHPHRSRRQYAKK